MKFKLSFIFLALSLLLGLSAQAAEAPKQAIVKVSAEFIAAIKQAEISDDEEIGKEQIKQLVDNHLSPYIDFRRVAYRTMAKHYKKASTKQFLAFEDAIKKSLINTYANPMLDPDSREELTSQIEVEIRDSRFINKKQTTASVSTWLKIGPTEKYDVIYSLYYKTKEDKWLVENLTVEGINLSLSFRNQFQRLYTENGGDIDAVTAIWAQARVDE